jgi:hypothetical protein
MSPHVPSMVQKGPWSQMRHFRTRDARFYIPMDIIKAQKYCPHTSQQGTFVLVKTAWGKKQEEFNSNRSTLTFGMLSFWYDIFWLPHLVKRSLSWRKGHLRAEDGGKEGRHALRWKETGNLGQLLVCPWPVTSFLLTQLSSSVECIF